MFSSIQTTMQEVVSFFCQRNSDVIKPVLFLMLCTIHQYLQAVNLSELLPNAFVFVVTIMAIFIILNILFVLVSTLVCHNRSLDLLFRRLRALYGNFEAILTKRRDEFIQFLGSQFKIFLYFLRSNLNPPLSTVHIMLDVVTASIFGMCSLDVVSNDIFISLMSTLFGIFFTVILIRFVIERGKEVREVPARIATLKNVYEVFFEISRLWMILVICGAKVCNTQAKITRFQNLSFFDKRLASTIGRVDLSSKIPIHSNMLVGKVVWNMANSIEHQVQEIMQNYSRYLHPRLLYSLDQISKNPIIESVAQYNDYNEMVIDIRMKRRSENILRSGQDNLQIIIGSRWDQDFLTNIDDLTSALDEESDEIRDFLQTVGGRYRRVHPNFKKYLEQAKSFDPKCKELLNSMLIALGK